MSLIEIIAVVFSLISVVQTIYQNPWCWITGIIGIVAYGVIFYDTKLYCEMLLQIIFIIQSIYGWFNWGKTKNDLPVTELSKHTFIIYIQITALISFYIYVYLKMNFNTAQPELDVATTMLSLLATWFLTKKYMENWHVWIIADFLFIIMFINEHLWLSSALYLIFLILAIKGLLIWKRDLKTA